MLGQSGAGGTPQELNSARLRRKLCHAKSQEGDGPAKWKQTEQDGLFSSKQSAQEQGKPGNPCARQPGAGVWAGAYIPAYMFLLSRLPENALGCQSSIKQSAQEQGKPGNPCACQPGAGVWAGVDVQAFMFLLSLLPENASSNQFSSKQGAVDPADIVLLVLLPANAARSALHVEVCRHPSYGELEAGEALLRSLLDPTELPAMQHSSMLMMIETRRPGALHYLVIHLISCRCQKARACLWSPLQQHNLETLHGHGHPRS